ncbi:putative surface protein with fasciclin (FAS1) repeats [Maribacter vaceletii]|uniref:Putative surface protein with fasciclin (FAS1) repeats n=1 Tax=Maribacter vaceletii TaxID=1206816 RepID=A0A495DRW5_9FLAO|nr:fasciclin domain-containing protein [Maribacter vaceletii]RKR06484.1 putative surface protein with fasciclin (FAS1) repeats [Maribacter vaceletii]
MEKLLKMKRYLLLSCFCITLFSCDKNDDVTEEKSTELSITATAQATESLSSLVAALIQADAGLVEALDDKNATYTVFAPTNDAFTTLLGNLDDFNSLEDFDTEEEKALLAQILKYHVITDIAAKSTDLNDGQMITTLQEEDVTIALESSSVNIIDKTETKATVTAADIIATNGVVHLVDKVLLPQTVIDAINSPGNLVSILIETEPLSILKDAVIKADLVETLSSEGPFTVFAPTNDAFAALLDVLGDDYNSLDDFDTEEEINLLKNILLFHVIPNATVKAGDLTAGEVGTAFTNNSVSIIDNQGTFVIVDASEANTNITGTDIIASNGVAHTIDKVLLPQVAIDFVTNLNLKTIVELAVETNDLSVLVSTLQQADAGLVETLSGDGPFTVFAPTNDAFIALLESLGDEYNAVSDFDTDEEKALLVKILTYHVIGNTTALSTDLSNHQEITTLQSENITINLTGGVYINDATDTPAQVTAADVIASNGVVHIIDKVLLPQEVLDILNPNIVATAQSVSDLSLLVEALIQADAGLVDTLSGEGPFTVFAPTNAAFTSLLDLLGNDYNSLEDFDTPEEKTILTKILTYHVISGASVKSTDLTDHQEIIPLQGESIFALVGNSIGLRDKTSTDANVTTADVMTSNGIVHIIDKVLLPQEVLDALGH